MAKYPYCITDGIPPPGPSEPAASSSSINTATAAGLPPQQFQTTPRPDSQQLRLHTTPPQAGGSMAFQDAIIQGVSQRLLAAVQDAVRGPSTAALVPVGEAVAPGPAVSTVLTHGAPRDPHQAPIDSVMKVHMLKLGDGTLLHLADDEIPDPPAVSFFDDIPRLNAMWDDHTEHWEGKSVFMIQGHPIAIEHWPLLYRYGRERQWQGTKGRWSDYRVCSCSSVFDQLQSLISCTVFHRTLSSAIVREALSSSGPSSASTGGT